MTLKQWPTPQQYIWKLEANTFPVKSPFTNKKNETKAYSAHILYKRSGGVGWGGKGEEEERDKKEDQEEEDEWL